MQTLAKLAKSDAFATQESMFCAHERDGALWRIEWKSVCECIINAGACAARSLNVLRDLQVYPDRMRENLFAAKGLLMSERVMFALGEKIGKQTAHEVIYRISMEAFTERAQFRDKLLADPTVTANLSTAEIDELMEPSSYTGFAGEICDKVVASIEKARQKAARPKN